MQQFEIQKNFTQLYSLYDVIGNNIYHVLNTILSLRTCLKSFEFEGVHLLIKRIQEGIHEIILNLNSIRRHILQVLGSPSEIIRKCGLTCGIWNGVVKAVDFKPFLKDAKNLLIPLLDIGYFKSFSVDDTTICWPNEVDFCPDVLYKIGKNVEKTKNFWGKTYHRGLLPPFC